MIFDNFHLGYTLSTRIECFENVLTGQVGLQWKMLKHNGLTFITQSIVLKVDTSSFKAKNKHKKNFRDRQKASKKDKYRKLIIISTSGTKPLHINNK